MLNWSNTSPTGAAKVPGISPYVTNGSRIGWVVYAATARDLNDVNGGANVVIDEADRTATTCYMRGLSEHLKFQTSSGVPWLHRRIAFCVRGVTVFHQPQVSDAPITVPFNRAETSNGWTRSWIDMDINNAPLSYIAQRGLLFRGQEGADWTDIMSAQVDTRRVDLKFDKVYRISSGNANGVFRERKLWHPMNKNLVYDDDESGAGENGGTFSVNDKRGMGDYFIVDIFQPGTGATATDYLQVTSATSLYWHEK